MKNILCFEGEWKFNTHKKPERFDLNSEPILRMLKEYHKCDAIYRHILTKEDLKLYIEYFNRNKREWNKIDIVYIACHGWFHSISLEGENGNVDLQELADIAGDFLAQGGLSVAGRCRCLTKDSNTSIEKEGYIPYSLQA